MKAVYACWLFSLAVGFTMCTRTPETSLGSFDGHTDIGNVGQPGTVHYDNAKQTFRIGGSGTNMWLDQDEFHFVWKKTSGDFILTAEFEFIGEGVDPHRKVGWMVRQTLEPNSPYADAIVHGDGLTSLQYRSEPGGTTDEVKANYTAPDVLQLERQGDTFIMRAARFGAPLHTTGAIQLGLGDSVYVGLAICAHNNDAFEEARVRNVRITVPAPADFTPYQDYSGSRLEILDVETGLRRVIYETTDPIEAPNWTPDGKALIYNSQGLLYRLPLDTREPEQIDTGFADRLNNDHVISFDGTQLGISHHVEDEESSGSAIFTLPIDGGEPQRVTENTPSYLHGWSPDGQYLTYTARRNDQYDIYKIPTQGGEEIQLTNQPSLDDGSEYTPDGEFIYFNSARTGTMQIWRMRPDGSNQEQLTYNIWNDWFPHPSPDGKWVIFLSYHPDIDAQDHPHYKHVMLRVMPLEGGDPQPVAYVYGGQGTINVPSWSPDSKKVAFVSYTF
mgnify:CR=1 FL=1